MSVIFQSTCQISVTGARARHTASAFLFGKFTRLNIHHINPVLKIPITDEQGNWRAERLTVPHPGNDFGFVALNFHTPATPVALLPSPELMVDKLQVNR